MVIAAAGGELTEVFGFSWLCKVSGARGRAREACPVGPFLRGGWEGSGGLPGTRSAPGRCIAISLVLSPRARSGSKAVAGSGPDANLAPFPNLELGKCELARWRRKLGR